MYVNVYEACWRQSTDVWKKNDINFLIFQEKTRIMPKYEVIFLCKNSTCHFFLKKVYQCFREFLIKTIHSFTSIWKKMILLNQIMLKWVLT